MYFDFDFDFVTTNFSRRKRILYNRSSERKNQPAKRNENNKIIVFNELEMEWMKRLKIKQAWTLFIFDFECWLPADARLLGDDSDVLMQINNNKQTKPKKVQKNSKKIELKS